MSAFSRRNVTLFTIAGTLLTGLRAYIFPFYPVLPFVLYQVCRFRIPTIAVALFGIAVASTIVARVTIGDLLFPNVIVSFIFIYPIVFLMLVDPRPLATSRDRKRTLDAFWQALTYFQLPNNCIGAIQFFIFRDDDAFIGFYGRHGLANHGLGIINALLFLHYFGKATHTRRPRSVAATAFFGVSFILAFYGMGLVCLLAAIAVGYLTTANLKRLLFAGAALAAMLLVLQFVNPDTFDYSLGFVTLFLDLLTGRDLPLGMTMPRKLLIFYDYATVYSHNVELFLFGSGPGSFNSRTSFLFNGDYNPHNWFETLFGIQLPRLAVQYAYPLWNRAIVDKRLFTDGTANQPFSSLISMFAEYGAIFSTTAAILVTTRVVSCIRALARVTVGPATRELRAIRDYVRISSIFVLLLIVGDNFLENGEILIFVLAFKLTEAYAVDLEVEARREDVDRDVGEAELAA
jgi:hypothetical protein